MKLTIILAILTKSVYSFPNGAPESVCFTLTPGHGSPPQEMPSQVTIQVETNVVIRGDSIQITISSPKEFRGFLIQPRTVVQPPQAFGTFEENAQVKTLNCLGRLQNTATHTVSTPRFNQTVTWNSGDDFLGAIRFQ